MTGWGVECTPRPAYRPSTGPAAGGSAPMPPHSQGAERRREHRRGRTGSRWGLRALVVGGLAGAAWLLSGAAAHATDRDLVSDTLSAGTPVLGAVLNGTEKHDDGVLPAVHRLLSRDAGGHGGLGAVVSIPKRIVDTASETVAIPVIGEPDDVVRDLPAPDRPAGEAEDSRPAPAAVPVPDLPRDVAEPAPAKSPVHPPERAADERETGKPVTVTEADAPAPVLKKAVVRAQVGKTAVRQHAAGIRHEGLVTAVPEAVRETPDGDGPAPLRARLGAASGIPAAGPGAATDGGASAAVLPATVAGGPMASHRLPVLTDAEVRRHDAEAPTVSPD